MAQNRKPDPDQDKKRQEQMARSIRYGVTYIIVGFIAIWLFQQLLLRPLTVQAVDLPYSEFKTKLAAGQIVSAVIGDNDIGRDEKHGRRDPGAADGQPAGDAGAGRGGNHRPVAAPVHEANVTPVRRP